MLKCAHSLCFEVWQSILDWVSPWDSWTMRADEEKTLGGRNWTSANKGMCGLEQWIYTLNSSNDSYELYFKKWPGIYHPWEPVVIVLVDLCIKKTLRKNQRRWTMRLIEFGGKENRREKWCDSALYSRGWRAFQCVYFTGSDFCPAVFQVYSPVSFWSWRAIQK